VLVTPGFSNGFPWMSMSVWFVSQAAWRLQCRHAHSSVDGVY